MGVPVAYLYPRHTAVVERMGKEHGAMAYRDGGYLFSDEGEGEIKRITQLANLSGRLKHINQG